MGLFDSIRRKNRKLNDSPEALQQVKWGIASPLMLKFSGGIESIRGFGTFSCSVNDLSRLEEEGFDIEDVNSMAQLKLYLTDLLVSSFRDVLGRESPSMELEEMIGSMVELAQAVKEDTLTVFSKKGLELSGFVVMKIVKA